MRTRPGGLKVEAHRQRNLAAVAGPGRQAEKRGGFHAADAAGIEAIQDILGLGHDCHPDTRASAEISATGCGIQHTTLGLGYKDYGL